jgi:hypothetical protein
MHAQIIVADPDDFCPDSVHLSSESDPDPDHSASFPIANVFAHRPDLNFIPYFYSICVPMHSNPNPTVVCYVYTEIFVASGLDLVSLKSGFYSRCPDPDPLCYSFQIVAVSWI